MNYKHGYKELKACGVDTDCAVCKPKHKNEKEILLECGEGTGRRTFTSSDDVPFQLARVTVDTTSLKRSEILIKFSSLVKAELVNNAVVRLKYELFRSCGGRQPLSIGSWIYEKDTNGSVFNSVEESFDFMFCECQTFNDCCDYLVVVTPIEIIGDGVTATVRNGRMAALTQALCDDSKKENKKI